MTKKEIFDKYKNIAVYGMSTNFSKAAFTVPGYMLKQGYNVIPIHPTAERILKQDAYKSISDIPDRIDILNIFRPSDEAEDIVKEAIARKKEKGDIELIWLQLGLSNEKAKKLAEDNGIDYIEDECIYVEHKKAKI